jgi:hypothetical protein
MSYKMIDLRVLITLKTYSKRAVHEHIALDRREKTTNVGAELVAAGELPKGHA